MATFRRAQTEGATYFFTVVTRNRLPILLAPSVLAALREGFTMLKKTSPFRLEAFVVLPDHLHCIWTLPDGDADYAGRWSRLKRHVSQQTRDMLPPVPSVSMEKRRELSLWQRRFWEHQIRDEQDLARHMDYIHWNPVKHGHVRAVADWPHSSFHHLVGVGLYPADWGSGSEPDLAGGDYGE